MSLRRVYAVDPGPIQSALVVFDGVGIVNHQTPLNCDLLEEISNRTRSREHVLVVEQIASFGMPVGAEVFETCVWSGRFIQAWAGYPASVAALRAELLLPINREMLPMPWDRVKRHEVKAALCGNQRAKDAHIRQALIDRFGPGKQKAIGLKASPGPLYGIAGDEWSALAVAVTWWDQHHPVREASA